jgi:hypothetical protein
MIRILVATRSILYNGREFRAGAPLPLDDPMMVEAWIHYGSAVYLTPEASDSAAAGPDPEPVQAAEPEAAPKAAPVHAPVVKGRTRKKAK